MPGDRRTVGMYRYIWTDLFYQIASQAPQSKEAALDTLKRLAATSDICYSQETLWFYLFRRAQGMQCRGSTPI